MANEMERLFYPKSLAIVGATAKKTWNWSSGNSWIDGSIKMGFQGSLYPVHPSAETVMGYRAYPSILDVPDDIDLVVFTVPLTAVAGVMHECLEKGVKFVHILTAGFAETGRMEYAEVEESIVEIARRGDIRIIGPNCMGVYCPEGGLSWTRDFPAESGAIGILSQSGQLAYEIIAKGEHQKVRFSKVVSFGNASDLQAHEILNYFAQDEKTEIVAAYLEGIKDGRAFLDAARQITGEKPLILWKGGQTEGGSRATVSHTSAIAGSMRIWDAMCKQTGIIPVHSLDELIYTIGALQKLPIPKGNGVAVVGGAGGGSVTMTDFAEKEGLRVPPLSNETVSRLEEFIPLQGNSVKNPLDILPIIFQVQNREGSMLQVMEILREDPEIDALIYNFEPSWVYGYFGREALNRYLQLTLESMERFEKPLFIALPCEDDFERDVIRREVGDQLHELGVATFPTFSLAARVMNNMLKYHAYLGSRKITAAL